jgi:hypothetical protein
VLKVLYRNGETGIKKSLKKKEIMELNQNKMYSYMDEKNE